MEVEIPAFPYPKNNDKTQPPATKKYHVPNAGSRTGKALAGVGGARIWPDGFDSLSFSYDKF